MVDASLCPSACAYARTSLDSFPTHSIASSPLSTHRPLCCATNHRLSTQARAASPSSAGTSLPLAAGPEIRESLSAVTDDMAYAQDIELRNGRWAMIGFLAAVAVEAGTGKGIIMQLIMYLKWSGLLGPMSGF